MKAHHQRWLSLAWFALCAYGAAFLLLFWEDHGPRGAAVAHAENIRCERNWLLLGTRWSCSAIVTDSSGVQTRFTSDSSLLTPADTSVPMQRLGPLDFVPARASSTPAPWPTMSAVVLIGAGFLGTGIWWQNSRSRHESPRAEVRRLRRHTRWYVGAGLLALAGAHFTYGLLIAARADFWPRPAEGTGVVTSCDRDWRYLGTSWRCAVTITPDTGGELGQTMSHSQFTAADVGTRKPVTFTGSTWESVDQPYEHRFAKTLMVLLFAGGVALVAKPLYDRPRIHRLEKPGLPPRLLDIR